MNTPRHPRAAFTLIELLVVIAIIAILASLTFVAFNAIRTSAKLVRATADAKAIAGAVRMFEVEYGVFPTNTSSQFSVSGEFLLELTGTSTSTSKINVKGIRYLDVPAAQSVSGSYVNPFYTTGGNVVSNTYQIMIDDDYNGVITGMPTSETGDASITNSVAVWMRPITAANISTNRNAKSWK